MKINIFLLCYNEELLLPHTIKFYKTNFPNATIHIVDNYSTDSSCDIAEKNDCKIIKYDSNGQQDERILIGVRSHIWKKHVTEGWVIMCDMDEWLNITEADLENEENMGKTIITTNGVNMVGESNTIDFSDINLFEIKKGVYDERFSKKICFKYPDVNMEYWWGAHTATAYGTVLYSDKAYLLKHYNYLGEQYLIEKYRKRYERNQKSREMGMNGHYLNNIEEIKNVYKDWLNKAITIE